MTGTLPSPWKVLSDPDGLSTPFYVIPFDREGECTGPETLDQLVRAAGNHTDVFVFSHGWNSDWGTAIKRYEDFATAFIHERRKAWRPPARDYKPLLVGVFWPSASLVPPWDQSTGPAGQLSPELRELAVVAEHLPADQARRLYELARHDVLDKARTAELAAIIAPLLGGEHDELDPGAPPPPADELLKVWQRIPGGTAPADGDFIEMPGFPDRFDPRKLIRMVTVLLAKDRAGRVGGAGIATMLHRLADASPGSRLHLVGHSYGAKVVLSALCRGEAPSRDVDSVLLLQPAMSCLSFASDVDKTGRPGGYRGALERTRGPIVTTFSVDDFALTRVFPWAVRSRSDLGEAVVAGAPPSRYAALGGHGPHGADADTVTLAARLLPQRYGFTATGKRIVAIDGTGRIHGHGDVTSPVTAWALLNQVME